MARGKRIVSNALEQQIWERYVELYAATGKTRGNIMQIYNELTKDGHEEIEYHNVTDAISRQRESHPDLKAIVDNGREAPEESDDQVVEENVDEQPVDVNQVEDAIDGDALSPAPEYEFAMDLGTVDGDHSTTVLIDVGEGDAIPSLRDELSQLVADIRTVNAAVKSLEKRSERILGRVGVVRDIVDAVL